MSVKSTRKSPARKPAKDTPEASSLKADSTLQQRAAEAVGSARSRALDAYDNARDTANLAAARASAKAGDSIDTAPLIALVGGLAVGALAGALMRKTKLEEKVLGGVGGRIAGAGRDAYGAARQAGQDKLAELDLTRDAGAKLVKSVLEGLGAAARSSGDAALGTVRKRDER